MSYSLGAILSGKRGHIAPSRYWMLTDEEIKEKSNGCGPGSWKLDLVPDKILGVDFTESCNIHDICFLYSKDAEDRRLSNRIFLYNLLVDVDTYCNDNCFFDILERIACREACFIYYKAVSDFGSRFSGERKR